jgi:ferredoxin-like protein FixX
MKITNDLYAQVHLKSEPLAVYNPIMIKMLEKMKKTGLNLWATIEISNLPREITDIFSLQKIPFDQSDTLCLIGNGGGELWNHLPLPIDQTTHPFDSFSIDQIKKLDGDAKILYPHPRWVIPLQKIGRLMNLSRPSHLGLDINDEFGVWFAYRGAFLTKMKFNCPVKESFESPCLTCLDRPCIKACPAQAVDTYASFNMSNCANHRLSKQSDCLDLCQARLVCPYQQKYQYSKEQIQYHMTNIHLHKMLRDYVGH